MHEVKIYGDIVHVSDKTDKNVSLLDLQSQLSEAKGEPIKVRLNSNGGDVNEGFAMYYEIRRYAKEHGVSVKTFAESRLNSIATVIFLAGDERELSAELQPFVHDARKADGKEPNDWEKSHLKAVNARIAEHYAKHTDLTIDEALELMENETYIPTEMAKNMRFATNVEEVFRPVAFQKYEKNLNQQIDMNKNPKTENVLNKVVAFFKSLGAVNKLLATADEKELDFYELGEDDVVEKGAKARLDGKDADGSFVMKSGETYVFTAGELTEIVEKAAEEVNEEVVALQNTINELTEKLEAVTNKAVEQVETITALEASNKANLEIINKYKGVTSAPVVVEPTEAPRSQTVVTNNLDESINNLRTIKLK